MKKSMLKPERVCKILEKIAKGFNSESEEYFSIELSAKALLFIQSAEMKQSIRDSFDGLKRQPTHEQKNIMAPQSFRDFLDTLNQNWTSEQKSFLASIRLK